MDTRLFFIYFCSVHQDILFHFILFMSQRSDFSVALQILRSLVHSRRYFWLHLHERQTVPKELIIWLFGNDYFGRQTPLIQAPIINLVHPSTPFNVRNMKGYVSVDYTDSTSRATWWRRRSTSVWGLKKKKNLVGGISLERDCGITMLTGLDSSGSSRENERSHREQIKTALAAAVGEVFYLFIYFLFFISFSFFFILCECLQCNLPRLWSEQNRHVERTEGIPELLIGIFVRPQSLIEFAVFSSGIVHVCERQLDKRK